MNNSGTLDNKFEINNTSAFNNNGTINNDGFLFNNWIMDNSGILNNNVEVSNNQTILNGGSFNNNGALYNDGSITNTGTLNNQGTIFNTGAIHNNGVFSNTGSVENDGVINNTGLIDVAAGSNVMGSNGAIRQSAGTLNVDGAVSQLVVLSGGTVTGSGSITSTWGSVIVDGAAVAPGNSPGILTINGDIDFLNAAILSVELGGLTAITDYDVLDVYGMATLAADTIIELVGYGGFGPQAGDFFDILVADTLVAGPAFNLTLSGLPGWFDWNAAVVDVGGRDALRVTASAVPVPGSLLLLVSGLGGAAILAARRRAGR